MVVKTEHIHVIRNKSICGGRPVVRGTRSSVQSIVGYYKEGLTPEEIQEGLPHLSLSQIYDALSYYHDHRAEVEKDIEATRIESVLKGSGVRIDTKGFVKKVS